MKRTSRYEKSEFVDTLIHNGLKYRREECIMDGNHHTIRWNYQIKDESRRQGGPLFYFSKDMGWGGNYPDGVKRNLSKDNPIPEVEVVFQREIRRQNKIKKLRKL
jgi:hypothetical protein